MLSHTKCEQAIDLFKGLLILLFVACPCNNQHLNVYNWGSLPHQAGYYGTFAAVTDETLTFSLKTFFMDLLSLPLTKGSSRYYHYAPYLHSEFDKNLNSQRFQS